MKKFIKSITTHTLTFILGLAIAGGIGIVVAENIASSTVDYNKNSQATVEDALDDLYSRASAAGIIPYSGPNLALHIQSLYSYDGDGSYIYYHDQTGNTGSYTGAEYEAGDLSYRFSGSSESVENYVCFASDEATCPSENLYRIIGIFKDSNNEYQVKLIKATVGQSAVNGATMLGTNGAYKTATEYRWHTSTANTWKTSTLNTTNLNTNYVAYLNAINSKWMNMIETHTWKVAGNTEAYVQSTNGVNNVYYREITSPSASTTYSAAIGLMYVSDYMYGASPNYWSLTGSGYSSAKTDNWLALGSTEWAITRKSDDSKYAFIVSSSGSVNYGYVVEYEVERWQRVNGNYVIVKETVTDAYTIRPVFYLNPNVIYYDGTGTSGDPYRIALSE